MAIEAQAKIVLRGGTEALRAMQGVSRQASAATKEARAQAKAQEQAQRAAVRAHNERMRAAQRESATVAREAGKSARAREQAERQATAAANREGAALERLQQRQADRWQRLARQSADYRMREEQRVTAQAQREAAKQSASARKAAEEQAKARRDSFNRAGGMVTGAVASVAAGALVANSTARGIAGVKDVKQRVMDANAFNNKLILTAGQAGMSTEERETVKGQVLAASQSTGTDIGELMGVLDVGQSEFNNLKFFADNLKEISTIAKAGDADAKQFAKALGSVQVAFGLNEEQAMQAAYLMKSAADKGQINIADFAQAFAPSAGQFALNTKQTGMEGLRQFLGTAQGIGTGLFGGAESSTRMDRFISDLNDVGVQKKLSEIGVNNIKDSTGKIDIGSVLDKLATNRKFQDAGVRQGIFEDIRGREGVETLLAARAKVKSGKVAGAVDFNSIANVTEQAGRDSVATNMAALQQDGSLAFEQEAAKMQAEVVENLKGYNDQLLTVVKAGDSLESSFGRLSVWADSIAAVGVGGVLTNLLTKGGGGEKASMLGKVLQGGAGLLSKGASAAGGLLKAGATGAIGLAGGTAAGAAVVGGALGGAVGYGANKLTSALRDDGQDISDLIASKVIEYQRNASLTSGGKRNEDGTLVQAVREQTRMLGSIDSGLRASNAKPNAGGSREPR